MRRRIKFQIWCNILPLRFSFEGCQHRRRPQEAVWTSFSVCDPSDLWILLSECLIRDTQSVQNKQEAQSDANMFQIICKVQRVFQNCATTWEPLRWFCRQSWTAGSTIAEHNRSDESERLLCSLISELSATKGSAACTSLFLVFCWRRHSEEEMLERKIPSSGSLLNTSRTTGLSETPCAGFQLQRGCINTCLLALQMLEGNTSLKDEIQPEKLNG